MLLRRFLLACSVSFSLVLLSVAGCGGTESGTSIPQPGSASDPLKEAPAPKDSAPPKNTPDPSRK
jgi:hypothetical protein